MGALGILLLPLLLAGVGLAFIIIAARDQVGARSDDESLRLPTRRERPLYHLHMQIRSSIKPPSASRASGPIVAKLPSRRKSGSGA
jgi:hypothetical protein